MPFNLGVGGAGARLAPSWIFQCAVTCLCQEKKNSIFFFFIFIFHHGIGVT